MNGQRLKSRVFELLKSVEFEGELGQLKEIPIHRLLNVLLSALCNNDEEIKWHAVTAMGILIADLAEQDMEAARNIMRRFMWYLNEESGGIGWGVPEAMGEIMARHKGLAHEFAHILVSYIRKGGNFLEYDLLRRGVVWGLGRLAMVRPQLLGSLGVPDYLQPFLESRDATVRGLAAWTMGLIGTRRFLSQLEGLLGDEAEIRFYRNQKVMTCSVREFAKEALQLIKGRGSDSLLG